MRQEKPVDRWLAILGLIGMFILYLLPKTPGVIVVGLAVCLLLLAHPIWNFWWIEKKLSRRFGALVLAAGVFMWIGSVAWPTSETEIHEIGFDVAFNSQSPNELIANVHIQNDGPETEPTTYIYTSAFGPNDDSQINPIARQMREEIDGNISRLVQSEDGDRLRSKTHMWFTNHGPTLTEETRNLYLKGDRVFYFAGAIVETNSKKRLFEYCGFVVGNLHRSVRVCPTEK